MKLPIPILLFCFLLSGSGHALAQSAGVRAGVSASPDQFFAGLHYESGELLDHLRFRPNLEIGTGSDQTLVALNVEFVYHVPLTRRAWNVYLGAGPALNIYRRTNDTSPEGGFNVLVGIAHRGGLFTELKAGLGDSPSAKFAVGYSFGA